MKIIYLVTILGLWTTSGLCEVLTSTATCEAGYDVLPVMTYGAETLPLTIASAEKLTKNEKIITWGVTAGPRQERRFTQEDRGHRCGLADGQTWAGHVARIADSRWTKRLLEWRPRTDKKNAEQEHCTVHQIRVSPCAEAASGKPCKIKKGTSANIQFDFTPHFDATTVTQRAYKTGGFIDLPLIGMDSDGCASTKCPIVSGQNSTYDFNLLISTSFPVGTYNVKWRLWNPDEETKECCFIYKLKLTN